MYLRRYNSVKPVSAKEVNAALLPQRKTPPPVKATASVEPSCG